MYNAWNFIYKYITFKAISRDENLMNLDGECAHPPGNRFEREFESISGICKVRLGRWLQPEYKWDSDKYPSLSGSWSSGKGPDMDTDQYLISMWSGLKS